MPSRPTRRPRFVVHEHRATRLHYDVRLELGGVLRSWAVPKGPSMDPADRRLAVAVPDHPLDYADFEGVIPAGSYGAGPVVVWDRGTWEADPAEGPAESQLRRGTLAFVLHGEKLRGGFALVRLRRGRTGRDWLLLKRKDAHAQPGWMLETELTPRRLRALREVVPPCETS
jgi:bifunctional non-homologous end joining protein LigD